MTDSPTDEEDMASGRIAIGVDVGGSGIKGAVVDTESGRLRSERLRVPTPQPATPGAVSASSVASVDESQIAESPQRSSEKWGPATARCSDVAFPSCHTSASGSRAPARGPPRSRGYPSMIAGLGR